MIKTARVELGDQAYHLFYSIRAMIDVEEACGADFLDKIASGGSSGAETTVKAFTILATEGELARRRMGYDPGVMPDEDRLMLDSTPGDWLRMRTAIQSAVLVGLDQEFPSTDDVDLILLEYQKKTENQPAGLST